MGHQDLHDRDRIEPGVHDRPDVFGPIRSHVKRSWTSDCSRRSRIRPAAFTAGPTTGTLRKIVKKIDELEKTEVKSIQYMQYAEHRLVDPARPDAAGRGNARRLYGLPKDTVV